MSVPDEFRHGLTCDTTQLDRAILAAIARAERSANNAPVTPTRLGCATQGVMQFRVDVVALPPREEPSWACSASFCSQC
jgi:hypothetical protein